MVELKEPNGPPIGLFRGPAGPRSKKLVRTLICTGNPTVRCTICSNYTKAGNLVTDCGVKRSEVIVTHEGHPGSRCVCCKREDV
jgi:hypothetical protein